MSIKKQGYTMKVIIVSLIISLTNLYAVNEKLLFSQKILNICQSEKLDTWLNFESKNYSRNPSLISKLIQCAQSNIAKDNLIAQHFLSIAYMEGKFIKKNQTKAVEIMKSLVKKDYKSVSLSSKIGRYYFRQTKDGENVVKWIKKAAKLGEEYSQYRLGIIYKNGLYVNKDIDKAIFWFSKAAVQGEQKSYNELLSLQSRNLSKQLPTPPEISKYLNNKEYKKAYNYFIKTKYNFRSQFNLGLHYENGLFVKKDYQKAFVWYLKSAMQGFDRAQNKVGEMYKYANGVNFDRDKALFWFRKAALQNNSQARSNMDFIGKYSYDDWEMVNNLRFNRNDNKLALEILQYLIQKDKSKIYMYELAELYYDLNNVDKSLYWYEQAQAYKRLGVYYKKNKNIQKSKYFFEKAYIQNTNDSEVLEELIKIYLDGHGIKYTKNDNKLLLKWLDKEISKKNTQALFILGYMNQKGLGLTKNLNKATILYTQAMQIGHKKASYQLINIYINSDNDNKNKKIVGIYKKLASDNDIKAINKLIFHYKSKKNYKIKKIISLYQKLIVLKEEKAFIRLANLYKRNGDIAEAERLYLEAIKEFHTKSVYEGLANLYKSLEKYAKAIELYKKLFDLGEVHYADKIGDIYRLYLKDSKNMMFWYKKGSDNYVSSAMFMYDKLCKILTQEYCEGNVNSKPKK